MEPRRRATLLLLVIYVGYISLGLPDGSLGVAWPAIYPELEVPLGLAGTIVTIGTILTGIAGFSSGWIIARWSTGTVMLASGLLTASGLLVLSGARSAWWLYASAIPLGLGAGAVDAVLNGYVARHYLGRHMNWLHACWGIGATTGPIFMGWALGAGPGWRGGYLALGLVQFGMAALFLSTLNLWTAVPERLPESTTAGGEERRPTLAAHSRAGWLSPVIFALYVAVEATVGLWSGTVLVVQRGFTLENAGRCVAGFYAALTVGRILVGFVGERWGNRRVVHWGIWLAAVGLLGFAASASLPLAVTFLGLAGLGLAPVYPGLMHEVPRRFAPAAVQTVIGRQSGGASFGMAILPALAGAVAQVSLAAVPWMVLGVLFVLLATVRWLDRIT